MGHGKLREMIWLTYNELDFLDGLGNYCPSHRTQNEDGSRRKRLLKGYLLSMARRVNWEGVDVRDVEKKVRRELLRFA